MMAAERPLPQFRTTIQQREQLHLLEEVKMLL
jgi:hypothetical protein